MKVLVLGGYGLIGLEIMHQLMRDGMTPVGLGRSAGHGERVFPEAQWLGLDLAQLTTPEAWAEHIDGFDAVVNAAGALQSSGRDKVSAVQRDAIRALIEACETSGVRRFVQISAPGAKTDAQTEFLKSKGEADAALRASALNWVILRPGLVIAPTAYGGSSLLRMLAAVPLIQALIMADARIQSVDVGDVARAVTRSLNEPKLACREFDLVEPEESSLKSVVLTFRQWLGFRAPVRTVVLPRVFGSAIAALADLSGHFGWRSPLRSTALKVLEDNVVGDPKPWQQATGETLSPLASTLGRLPSSRQERLYARAQLVFPVALVTFAVFWIISGAIGFWRFDAAVATISAQVGAQSAALFVFIGSTLDVMIGIGLLIRRTFRATCFASVALSLGYLVAGTLVTPDLWGDPLGPFVKVLPAIMLALMLAAMGDER